MDFGFLSARNKYLMKFVFKQFGFFTASDHLSLVVLVFPVLDLGLNLGQKTVLNGQMDVGDLICLVKGAFQSALGRTVLWT